MTPLRPANFSLGIAGAHWDTGTGSRSVFFLFAGFGVTSSASQRQLRARELPPFPIETISEPGTID